MAIFTCLLTLALFQADYGYYRYDGGLGEVLARNTGGAAMVGLLGGLLGALFSLTIPPDRPGGNEPWVAASARPLAPLDEHQIDWQRAELQEARQGLGFLDAGET